MLRKVFSVSYRQKTRARLWRADGNRKVLGIFQASALICLVLLYNSPSLLTEWVKQNLAEISTTDCSEMKLKLIFGNSLQSDSFPHMSWCKDWIILDSCMRGKKKVYVTRSVERCYNCSWFIHAHNKVIILRELLQCMMYCRNDFPFMFIFSTTLCWAEHENLFNVMGCLHSH